MSDARLYVGNFPCETSRDELHALLSRQGHVMDLLFARDAAGRSKGFAFVTYGTGFEADEARRAR